MHDLDANCLTLKGEQVQAEQSEAVKSTNGEAVLERVGLNGGAVRNVMMHRGLGAKGICL